MEDDKDEVEFAVVRACAFCSVGIVWAAPHDHTQCPHLQTLNKVRRGLGIVPITVDGGVLAMGREKAPIDVEGKFKALEASVAELTKRVAALEEAAKPKGQKRKAEAPKAETAAKKAKGAEEKGKAKEGEAKGKGGDANAKASGSKPAGAKKGKGKKKE